MKLFTVVFLFFTLIAQGADKVAPVAPPPAPENPHAQRWRHVFDPDGKVLATLDTKDGSVDIKGDAKKVVQMLIQYSDQLMIQCNKALAEKDAVNAKKKK